MFITFYKCGRIVSLCDAQGPGCRYTSDSTEQGPGFGRSSRTAGWCGATARWFVFHTGCKLCSSAEQSKAFSVPCRSKLFRQNAVWIAVLLQCRFGTWVTEMGNKHETCPGPQRVCTFKTRTVSSKSYEAELGEYDSARVIGPWFHASTNQSNCRTSCHIALPTVATNVFFFF